MKMIDSGVVFALRAGTEYASNAFASICVLPTGRWLCGWRAAPAKSSTVGEHVLVAWSDDQGRTWHNPVEPFLPVPPVDGKAGSFRAAALTALGAREVLATLYWVDFSDPRRPFFNEATEGLLDSRIFFSRSRDGGAMWSRPTPMDTRPFTCPTPITGPVLLLPNGDWACQFELNKHYEDRAAWRHRSVLMFSRDGGRTWPEHVFTSGDPENRIFYWDQRPALLADGSLLDLFWTYDKEKAAYLNCHARLSRDHGRTWSEMWDTGVAGQPAPVVTLADGRLGMVFVDRTAAPVIKMRASADGGRTWPAETELLVQEPIVALQTWRKSTMQDAWAEMGKFSVGLPATATLAGGDILVSYYVGPKPDHSDIRWARVRA